MQRWNRWRKLNINSKLYKLLVLFGLPSPTFRLTLTEKELKDLWGGL